MDDGKVIQFRKRGDNDNNRPPSPPDLQQDTYRFVTYDRQGNKVEYEKTGHLIVTNVNIALLDENSELKWSIPNNSDLVFLERLDDIEVELDDDQYDDDYLPDDELPSEE